MVAFAKGKVRFQPLSWQMTNTIHFYFYFIFLHGINFSCMYEINNIKIDRYVLKKISEFFGLFQIIFKNFYVTPCCWKCSKQPKNRAQEKKERN